jgi:hypothetical protein
VRCVVFPLGLDPAALPPLGPGSWAPAGSGALWAGAFVWRPAAAAGVGCLFCTGVGACACPDFALPDPLQWDRFTRALDEGPYYRWRRLPSCRDGVFGCTNPMSSGDGDYIVSAACCSCEDWKTMEPAGIHCKHQLALMLAVSYPHMLVPCPEVPGVARIADAAEVAA